MFVPETFDPGEGAVAVPSGELCPFVTQDGTCPYADQCYYVHPLLCEYCDSYKLHPCDAKQREDHQKVN